MKQVKVGIDYIISYDPDKIFQRIEAMFSPAPSTNGINLKQENMLLKTKKERMQKGLWSTFQQMGITNSLPGAEDLFFIIFYLIENTSHASEKYLNEIYKIRSETGPLSKKTGKSER